MTGAIALGTVGLLVNLGLLVLAGARVRTASPLATFLYWLANVVLITLTAATLDLPPVVPAACAVALGVGFMLFRSWNAVARAFFSYFLIAVGLYLIYVGDLTFFTGLGLLPMAISGALLVLEVLAFGLTAVYGYEALDVLCRVRWRRRVAAAPAPPPDANAPFVSVHVPIYSEPPDLVIETLDALSRLAYPRFEVIVIDNNTKDRLLWEPVRDHCARLGPRFRFFHVDPLSGYKAGACNFALRQTDPAAEVVAIIDADYVVEPSFLLETVPHFRDPRVGFVQTPQDYREYRGNRYLTNCLRAYAYFFAISMAARNEYNAPIFGGTMGLVRRSVLEEIGGWDEWCITEDAEASLRILQRGYESVYVPQTYGRGLMPFDFDGYKKQRFRWCFGGVQILRKHWRALVPFWPRAAADRLTGAQRAWYLAAALQWFGEPLQLSFAAFLVAGGLAYGLGGSLIARPLLEAVLIFPVLFLAASLIRFLWALRVALRLRPGEALEAAISMFSLSWVVSQACLAAFVRPTGVFLRTSKSRATATLARALHATRWESAIALMCAGVGALVLARGPAVLGGALALLCFWQAFVYGSAFASCVSAIRSASADARPTRYRRRREIVAGRRVERRAAAAAAALGVVFFLMAGVANAPPFAEEFKRAQTERAPLLPPQARESTPTPLGPPSPSAQLVPAKAPGATAGGSNTPQPTAALFSPASPPAAAATTAPLPSPPITPLPRATPTAAPDSPPTPVPTGGGSPSQLPTPPPHPTPAPR
jgi:cellulose synthase/poly-beta-1,6-N-acetylglucosamine synthase-like glycosyltransferase